MFSQTLFDSIKQRQEIIDEYNSVIEKQNAENANKQKILEKNKAKEKDDDLVKSAPIKKKKKTKTPRLVDFNKKV